MNKYIIIYQCSDGHVGEETVYAVNRMMAFDLFGSFEYKNVVNVDVFRATSEEEEESLQ